MVVKQKRIIRTMSLPILSCEEIAKSTYELKLDITDEDISYDPGQFVVVDIGHNVIDGRGRRKSFSLSSNPTNKEFISTCFRLPEPHTEFKEYVTTAESGFELMIQGPMGEFVLPKSRARDIVMIAGGVGVVPFMSMIDYSTHEKKGHHIRLFYTTKSRASAPYLRELQQIEERHHNFELYYRTRRVDPDFIRDNCDIKDSVFYICGTPAMIKGVREILIGLGVREERIVNEEFNGY